MVTDNPLSRAYLREYPAEAANVLERVPVEHVGAMFVAMPTEIIAPALAKMLPKTSAACLASIPAAQAAEFVAALPPILAARLLRLLQPEPRAGISAGLAENVRAKIERYLHYAPGSAGSLLDAQIDSVTMNMTVGEARRHLEAQSQAVAGRVFVTDNAHHLVGHIDLGRLVVSRATDKIKEVMSTRTQSVSVYATVEMLLGHPGWKSRRRLPVVERDNTLIGVIDYRQLVEQYGESQSRDVRDPLQNLLSIAGLYWLTVTQLLDSMLGMTGAGKRGRR